MAFSRDQLHIVPLYRDEDELRTTQSCSTAASALTKVQAVYHALFFPEAPATRPYTFASIVLSFDGKMAFPDDPRGPRVASANELDPAGGQIDYWILNVLRAHADASIIGARTLAAEPDAEFACLDPELTAERPTLLRKPDALIPIVVSLDGTDIPLDHRAFLRADDRPQIATSRSGGDFLRRQGLGDALWLGPYPSSDAVPDDDLAGPIRAARAAGRQVVVLTGDERPDAQALLLVLRRSGIEHLLIESPTYWWLLLGEKALDELFVNYSSVYIGGSLTPGIAGGFTTGDHPHAKPIYVGLHPSGFLYTRQKLVYGLEARKVDE
jgi:riboflavin biosynthesis pyrimidine reductase